MDERTLTALQGSIAKWEAIVNGVGHDDKADNCPLCKVFIDICGGEDDPAWSQMGCFGCPVAERVKQGGCVGTAWFNWDEYMHNRGRLMGDSRVVFDDISKSLAQTELDFLRSLLPVTVAAD